MSGGNVQPGTPWPSSISPLAVGPYDRTRALIDGSVQIDGVIRSCMTLSPEEIFFRAFRHAEFDICELSLSSFTVKTAQGNCPYVGVPAFVSRAFRHTSIYVRTDRIKKPEDLKGKRVGAAGISAHRQCLGARDPGGRLRRQALRHPLGARRHRGRRPAREDRHQAAARREARGRAGGQVDLGACWRKARSTASSRRAPPSLPNRHAECRLAVCRSGRRRQGLLQAHRHFPDHASGRRAPRDWSSSIRGCRARCSRPSSRRRRSRSTC